jgi:hypothetical protein
MVAQALHLQLVAAAPALLLWLLLIACLCPAALWRVGLVGQVVGQWRSSSRRGQHGGVPATCCSPLGPHTPCGCWRAAGGRHLLQQLLARHWWSNAAGYCGAWHRVPHTAVAAQRHAPPVSLLLAPAAVVAALAVCPAAAGDAPRPQPLPVASHRRLLQRGCNPAGPDWLPHWLLGGPGRLLLPAL